MHVLGTARHIRPFNTEIQTTFENCQITKLFNLLHIYLLFLYVDRWFSNLLEISPHNFARRGTQVLIMIQNAILYEMQLK